MEILTLMNDNAAFNKDGGFGRCEGDVRAMSDTDRWAIDWGNGMTGFFFGPALESAKSLSTNCIAPTYPQRYFTV